MTPYFVNVLESGLKVGGELTNTNILFIIRIQSPWQSMMVQQYGFRSVVIINITFGTNENKVSIFFVNLVHVSKPRNPFET